MKFATKVGYGVGQISEGVKTASFSTFLFFYYNQVLGLSGSLAGTAALLALVVDGFTDPMMGQLSDRFNSRWGRRHPFMLAGAIPFGFAITLLFSPPAGMGEIGLFAWMLSWAICVRLLLTLFYVPHLSLGAEMVKDYHERTALISYRVFFSYFGVLLVTVAGFTLFFPASEQFPNGMLNGANYPKFAMFAGILGTVAMLYSVFSTRSTIPHLSKPVHDPNGKHPALAFIAAFLTLRQRSFRILFITILLFMTMAGVTQTLLVYNASYIFGFSPEHLGLLASSVLLGIVGAPSLAQKLSRTLDKRQTLSICVFFGTVIAVSPTLLFLAGLFQPLSLEQRLVYVYLANGISQAFFIAYIIVIDSMLTDTIDENELATGRREEGLFFAARALSQKASYGLGSFFAGIGLDIIDFPQGANPADVPVEAVTKLAIVAGPVSMLFFLLTILISWRYPLDATKHGEILEEIERNKLADDPGALYSATT